MRAYRVLVESGIPSLNWGGGVGRGMQSGRSIPPLQKGDAVGKLKKKVKGEGVIGIDGNLKCALQARGPIGS